MCWSLYPNWLWGKDRVHPELIANRSQDTDRPKIKTNALHSISPAANTNYSLFISHKRWQFWRSIVTCQLTRTWQSSLLGIILSYFLWTAPSIQQVQLSLQFNSIQLKTPWWFGKPRVACACSMLVAIGTIFSRSQEVIFGDPQTFPEQGAMRSDVCVYVCVWVWIVYYRESSYLLWRGLGPGLHTAYPWMPNEEKKYKQRSLPVCKHWLKQHNTTVYTVGTRKCANIFFLEWSGNKGHNVSKILCTNYNNVF